MSDSSTIYDVIIIGGGLSGLSAAKRLHDRNADLKLLVLEAASQVGGRTRSITVQGPNGIEDSLDLGGHWVSSTQPHVLALMKELGIEYYPQNVKGTKVMEVGDNKVRTYTSDIPSLGSWMALVDVQNMITKIEKLIQEVDIRDPWLHPKAHELDAMTVATYIKQSTSHQGVYDMMNAAVQACMGTDSSQISMLYMAAYANSGGGLMMLLLANDGAAQEYRVKGGSQNLSLKLAELLGSEVVLTGKPVVGIDSTGDHVQVKCTDGLVYNCKRVICTTIASQTAKMEFQPPMPIARQSLLKSFFVGNLTKFYFLYETSFWLKKGYSGELVSSGGPSTLKYCENGPLTITYDATTSKGLPALVAFTAGRNADQWLTRPKKERHAAAVKQLETCFGKDAAKPTEIIEMNWMEEKWTGGAPVSVLGPGHMHNFHYMRKPHDRVVHFAGTETATEWNGYLSGAIQAGHRAAAEVLEALCKEKMEKEDEEIIKKCQLKSKACYRDIQRQKSEKKSGLCSIM